MLRYAEILVPRSLTTVAMQQGVTYRSFNFSSYKHTNISLAMLVLESSIVSKLELKAAKRYMVVT